eukprot:TRINITY_DN46513_c0_g1_i1.p1 TRINITY_DN46513_c0_g1~~TRINITY_DN46513_c0_g1_i1.p1  ORF type:complete len:443 (+),score=107.39 TRINITY_DN46513_c0_g1_i1:40-1368(+)
MSLCAMRAVVAALLCVVAFGVQHTPRPERLLARKRRSSLTRGLTSPLDEVGFQKVIATENSVALKAFILRVLDSSNMTVSDDDMPLMDKFAKQLLRTHQYETLPDLKAALFLKHWVVLKVKSAASSVVNSVEALADKLRKLVKGDSEAVVKLKKAQKVGAHENSKTKHAAKQQAHSAPAHKATTKATPAKATAHTPKKAPVEVVKATPAAKESAKPAPTSPESTAVAKISSAEHHAEKASAAPVSTAHHDAESASPAVVPRAPAPEVAKDTSAAAAHAAAAVTPPAKPVASAEAAAESHTSAPEVKAALKNATTVKSESPAAAVPATAKIVPKVNASANVAEAAKKELPAPKAVHAAVGEHTDVAHKTQPSESKKVAPSASDTQSSNVTKDEKSNHTDAATKVAAGVQESAAEGATSLHSSALGLHLQPLPALLVLALAFKQ